MVDESTASLEIERARLDLEKQRFRMESIKWIAIAAGAVASFAVIDYGKLQLERFRSYSENQRDLLKSYLAATDTAQPDVWTRKLKIILNMTDDEKLRQWANAELDYIQSSAARDALYREALKVASQLVEPTQLHDPVRKQLRARFNQLYWADLPFVGESIDVAAAMVEFRKKLMAAEMAGEDDADKWAATNAALINLSNVLRRSTTAPSATQPHP